MFIFFKSKKNEKNEKKFFYNIFFNHRPTKNFVKNSDD
jgi:hypothetical protein